MTPAVPEPEVRVLFAAGIGLAEGAARQPQRGARGLFAKFVQSQGKRYRFPKELLLSKTVRGSCLGCRTTGFGNLLNSVRYYLEGVLLSSLGSDREG
jgi:hypothetical protein